jgi:type IV pilus assembly protein PilC
MGLAAALTGRVPPRELLFFTSQLSLMLETGASLTDALGAIAAQTENALFRGVLERITTDVTGGKMFSSSLATHPKVFSTIYVSMVRAGEKGGFLNDMLRRLTEFQRLRQELSSKIWSNLAYPAVLTLMSLSVVIFMMTYVLPKFLEVFEGKEDILPLPTKLLMATSYSLMDYWYIYLAAALGLIVGGVSWLRTATGRRQWDRWKLRIPLTGKICQLLYASRLLRTLGVMLESGVPLLDGVDVTSGTVGNQEYVGFLVQLSDSVERGQRLADSFQHSPLFTPTIKQMVNTGEMSGNTGMVMLRMADHYDNVVAERLKGLTSLLEPLIVAAMGVTVGFIAMALFLPLFKISRAVH